MRDLPPAAHDPARLDVVALAKWMREKIAMQLDFAHLMERHAAASQEVLQQLAGKK
jgi:hypothetical protein